jgi:hypothetical protein
MDIVSNLAKAEKILKDSLSAKEFEAYERWKKLDGEEIELDIPVKDISTRTSFWPSFSLSSPELAARRIAQFIKNLNLRNE